MEEDIIKRIDFYKNDEEIYLKYIKSFCESEKAKEIYESDEEFQKLKAYIDKKEEKQEEY